MKPYILVVEDEAILYDGIYQILVEENFEVSDYIKSYDEAITAINSRKPDIVLLDINLQGKKDGLDLGAILYSHYNIPFVYLTELDDERVFKAGLNTHHNAFMVKSKPKLDANLLVRTIKTILNNVSSRSKDTVSADFIFAYVDYYENLKNIGDQPVEIPIQLNDIALISTRGIDLGSKIKLEPVKKNYCRIIIKDGDDFYLKMSLTEILKILPKQFVRISDSDIINMLPPIFEGKFNDSKLIVIGIECKLSSNYKEAFNIKMADFYKL